MHERKRFDRKVIIPDDPSGCWGWRGKVEKVDAAGRGGYVVIRAFGKQTRAHRLAWMLFRGPIPDGLEVAHKCDVRACVNPDHLFLATHEDNMRDMAVKGRANPLRGEANSRAKLTDADVAYIRAARWTTGETQAQLAERYGVTQPCISHIVRRKTWREA